MEAAIAATAYTYAQRIVALAVKATINDINAVLDRRPAQAPALPSPPAGVGPRNPMTSTVVIPKPRRTGVHANDYVEALIAIVHDAPWATRSRELRAMLGVKKDPFLRIVDAALATGRIVRTGYKATVTYLPAKDGQPLKVAASRIAAGARPKAKRPMGAPSEGTRGQPLSLLGRRALPERFGRSSLRGFARIGVNHFVNNAVRHLREVFGKLRGERLELGPQRRLVECRRRQHLHSRGTLARPPVRLQAIAPAQGNEQLSRPRIGQRVDRLYVRLARPRFGESRPDALGGRAGGLSLSVARRTRVKRFDLPKLLE